MKVTHTLKMDVQGGGLLQRLEMPMGDVGAREIEIYFYSNRQLWFAPEDATVVIRYKKPDGTVGEYDTMPDGSAAWKIISNLLVLKMVPQVLTVAGVVELYACIYHEEQLLHTFTLEINVRAPIAGTRSVKSENYTYMTNVLRGPVTAQVGQALAVSSVDDSGRVTEVAAVNSSELVQNSGAVLYTEQNMTTDRQNQARSNIGAASKAAVDFLMAKFTAEGIAMSDEKTGDKYNLFVRNGKLMLEKE